MPKPNERIGSISPPGFTGREIYNEVKRTVGDDPAKASEYLRGIGIPGIRYRDAMSRNDRLDKRHNYVVFPTEDPGMIKVKGLLNPSDY